MEKWVEELLKWFRVNARSFPWRGYRDWYRVLVAEVMLVRTKSETVEKIYRLFLEKFPKPEDLCKASVEEIKDIFKRLGLVQRAIRIREAVCLVLEKYGGMLPCSYEELISLPSVGRYIAKVLLTRVCNNPSPFIDANLIRVARRFLGLREVDVGYVEAWLEKLVHKDVLEDVNVALLDLAGTICKPRNPRCGVCPLNSFCVSAETLN